MMQDPSSRSAAGAAALVALVALPALAALAVLTAAPAAMAADTAAMPALAADQFAPDWQAHSRALFNEGPSRRDFSKMVWRVPLITAPGRYVLVNRHGGQATVIEGYDFVIDGHPERDILMFLPPGYTDVVALPAADVTRPKRQRGASGSM